jgi:hypothetical protein
LFFFFVFLISKTLDLLIMVYGYTLSCDVALYFFIGFFFSSRVGRLDFCYLALFLLVRRSWYVREMLLK